MSRSSRPQYDDKGELVIPKEKLHRGAHMGRLKNLPVDSGLNISHNMLIDAVARRSGYHKYEVQDVLRHLSKVIEEVMIKKGTVKLNGVGTFCIRVYGAKEWYDPKREKEFSSPEQHLLKLRVDNALYKNMNPWKFGIEPKYSDTSVILENFDPSINDPDYVDEDDFAEYNFDKPNDVETNQVKEIPNE